MNTLGNLKSFFLGLGKLTELEEQLNVWFSKNKVNIIDIKFNSTPNYHTVLILYYK